MRVTRVALGKKKEMKGGGVVVLEKSVFESESENEKNKKVKGAPRGHTNHVAPMSERRKGKTKKKTKKKTKREEV